MQFDTTINHDQIRTDLKRLRGDSKIPPHASVIIPVNAQGDLDNVLRVVSDVSKYAGRNLIEVILVINNYPADRPPTETIELYRSLAIEVVAIPSVRRPGEAVGFSARIPGIRAANSNVAVLFDADCRIANPTALLDWYVEQFAKEAKAAYSHVAYYELPNALSVRVRFAIHHLSRWAKRNVLGIPTTRGSNYAVSPTVMLQLYDDGMLADEMNVGPTFKSEGNRVVYSGRRDHYVFTSGRMFSSGWLRMIPYYWYRLRYNLRTLPVRQGVANFTKRESDPVRRFVDNRPVR